MLPVVPNAVPMSAEERARYETKLAEKEAKILRRKVAEEERMKRIYSLEEINKSKERGERPRLNVEPVYDEVELKLYRAFGINLLIKDDDNGLQCIGMCDMNMIRSPITPEAINMCEALELNYVI